MDRQKDKQKDGEKKRQKEKKDHWQVEIGRQKDRETKK
jgi:hypothetical protein